MSISVTPEPITIGQQVSALPAYVLAAWRSRYALVDGVDLEARAVLNQEAATVHAAGVQPDALTIWMRLTDKVVRAGSPTLELSAAAALAGLVVGVWPQGFDAPDAKLAAVEPN